MTVYYTMNLYRLAYSSNNIFNKVDIIMSKNVFFLNKIIVFSLSLSFKKTKYLSAAATVYYIVNLSVSNHGSNIIFNIANIMSKNAFLFFLKKISLLKLHHGLEKKMQKLIAVFSTFSFSVYALSRRALC